MHNKILVISGNKKEIGELELILQEVVESGGELFFAEQIEGGRNLLEKEQPHIIFLDEEFITENLKTWEARGGHLIIMRSKHVTAPLNEDMVHKPFNSHQILEKCHALLGKEPVAQLPPM